MRTPPGPSAARQAVRRDVSILVRNGALEEAPRVSGVFRRPLLPSACGEVPYRERYERPRRSGSDCAWGIAFEFRLAMQAF